MLELIPLTRGQLPKGLKGYRCLCSECREAQVQRFPLPPDERFHKTPRANSIFYSLLPLKELVCPWTGVEENLITIPDTIHHLIECEKGLIRGNKLTGTAHKRYRIACMTPQDSMEPHLLHSGILSATSCPYCMDESLPDDAEWDLPYVAHVEHPTADPAAFSEEEK